MVNIPQSWKWEIYSARDKLEISLRRHTKNIWSVHINGWTEKLQRKYADVDDEDGTKRFQAMFLIMSVESDRYSEIWNDLNNITFVGTDNYPKPQLPHTMYCVATKNRHHHAKYMRHLHQLHFFTVVIQRNIRQHKVIMGDPFQQLHAIASRI